MTNAKIFAILGKASVSLHHRFDLMSDLTEHLHKHLNELQEGSVLMCLEGINSILTFKQKQLTKQDPSATKLGKDLNTLVVEMAVANAELVDFFFLTRFLAKLSQFRDLRAVCSK